MFVTANPFTTSNRTIAGQLDSELTPLGFEDARSVAAAIGRRDFEIVYCSDLLRARQTAETIMNTLEFNCPVRYSPLIRELDYGRFTEKKVEETFKILNYKRVPDQRYPEGESFNDMQVRVRQFLSQMLDESAGKRILVAAHAGSIRIMAMLLDPANQQEHLDRAYGNRYIGRAVLDGDNRLVSFEVLQNPERGGF